MRPDAMIPGDIVTAEGRVLGQHDGIARFTVGQGKRLGNAAMDGGERMMVVATEPRTRRIVVGPRTSGTGTVRLRDLNWLVPRPAAPLRCQVKLRARDIPRGAWVEADDGGAVVRLDEPTMPAPGQACVFYDGDRVLGGGIIRGANA